MADGPSSAGTPVARSSKPSPSKSPTAKAAPKTTAAVTGIAIAHRVGRVEVGEASVAIAISAPHRREALAACAEAIDRLKATLPVWKKEVFADGSEWRENREEEQLDDGR